MLLISLFRAGAQGFHVQIDTCRGNCSIPAGQIVEINCTVAMGCDPLSHPLRMLRVTSEGIEEITPRDNDRGIMPGFISLETMECSLRLTFTASLAANNVVLQCGVSTNEVMEYSKARVLAVRGMILTVYTCVALQRIHSCPLLLTLCICVQYPVRGTASTKSTALQRPLTLMCFRPPIVGSMHMSPYCIATELYVCC